MRHTRPRPSSVIEVSRTAHTLGRSHVAPSSRKADVVTSWSRDSRTDVGSRVRPVCLYDYNNIVQPYALCACVCARATQIALSRTFLIMSSTTRRCVRAGDGLSSYNIAFVRYGHGRKKMYNNNNNKNSDNKNNKYSRYINTGDGRALLLRACNQFVGSVQKPKYLSSSVGYVVFV